MALKQSVKTTQLSSQASATAVAPLSSSQTNSSSNSLHHSALSTSVKITGVILFVVLASLIVVNAQASGKQANDEFNEANKNAVGAVLELTTTAKTGADTNEKASDTAVQDSGNSVSASVSNGSVEVTIDGKPVEVPAGTNYSKVVSDPNGTTTVQVNQSGTGSSFNSSSTFVSSSSFSSNSNNGGSNVSTYMYTSP